MDISLTSLNANRSLGRLGFQQIHPKTSAQFHWKVWWRSEICIDSGPAWPSLLISRDLDSQFTDSAWQAQKDSRPRSIQTDWCWPSNICAHHVTYPQKAATPSATTGPSRGSISRTWVQRMKRKIDGLEGWEKIPWLIVPFYNDLCMTDGGFGDIPSNGIAGAGHPQNRCQATRGAMKGAA